MDPELLNKVTWKIPNALALVGSAADGEWNGIVDRSPRSRTPG
jgi:hypothetical protein